MLRLIESLNEKVEAYEKLEARTSAIADEDRKSVDRRGPSIACARAKP
jgi:hypothetical protein